MILSLSNPYANGSIIVFEDNTAELDRNPVQLPEGITYQIHRVKENEFLDSICQTYYPKAENPAWYSLVLAEINDIDFPLDQESYVYKELLIPDFEELNLL